MSLADVTLYNKSLAWAAGVQIYPNQIKSMTGHNGFYYSTCLSREKDDKNCNSLNYHIIYPFNTIKSHM